MNNFTIIGLTKIFYWTIIKISYPKYNHKITNMKQGPYFCKEDLQCTIVLEKGKKKWHMGTRPLPK